MRQAFQPIGEIDPVDQFAVLIDQVAGLGQAFDELRDAVRVLPRPEFGVPTAPFRWPGTPPRQTRDPRAWLGGDGFDADIDLPAGEEVVRPTEPFTHPQTERLKGDLAGILGINSPISRVANGPDCEPVQMLTRPAEQDQQRLVQHRQRHRIGHFDRAHDQKAHPTQHQPKTNHDAIMPTTSTSPDL